MNFKELFKNSRWSMKQLAEESGLKISTLHNYISRNKPSQALLAAFDRLEERAKQKQGDTPKLSTQPSQVSLRKEEATKPKVATPMRELEANEFTGTIVALPINQYIRRVELDSGEVISAECKKDKWRGNRQRVVLKKVGDRYYISGLL